MKNTSFKIVMLLLLFLGINAQAQNKKWSLQECVDYALKNNISIKQTELDAETTAIGKKSALGSFLPSINANASHSWNIGLNQNITTGLLENQTTQFTSAGLNSNITIYNGLQNQNKLRKANLSIIAAQYQLSKMKDDIGLNVANAYLQILFLSLIHI
jgi:outer membrane protein